MRNDASFFVFCSIFYLFSRYFEAFGLLSLTSQLNPQGGAP